MLVNQSLTDPELTCTCRCESSLILPHHSNPSLSSLDQEDNWITERIEYNLLLLTYKVLITTKLPYLHHLITVQLPRNTRSLSLVTLACPPTSASLRITDCSFNMLHHVSGTSLLLHCVNLIHSSFYFRHFHCICSMSSFIIYNSLSPSLPALNLSFPQIIHTIVSSLFLKTDSMVCLQYF